MRNTIDVLDVTARLRAACETAGGQKQWAAANGVSGSYVCDVLMARREPGESILSALGLRKITRYVETRKEAQSW